MRFSIDGGITWTNSDEVRIQYDVFDEYGARNAVLNLTCTNEGVIQDAYVGETDECKSVIAMATSSQTAQEIFDDLTNGGYNQ